MTIKKLFSALILAVLILSSASCAPKAPPEDNNTNTYFTGETTQLPNSETQQTSPPENADKSLVLLEGGKWQYRIVTKAVRSAEEIEFSGSLSKAMSDIAGTAPHTANDTVIKDDSVCEIIIGCTKHPTARSLFAALGYGNACIKVEGNKIYVAAFSADGYKALLSHLTKAMTAAYSDGAIALTVGTIETQTTINNDLNAIPVASGGSFSSISNCGNGQTLVIHDEASESTFDDYVNGLKGAVCVSEIRENGNAFATFDIGSNLLNVSYSKGENRLRIILNKNTEPTKLFEKPEETKKVCDPLLIMHGLAWKEAGYTYYSYGMCMLIRLSDGRFIVIDGGFNRRKDADDLYGLLTKYNVLQGKPTIALWILTHAHIDHHGTFALQFYAYYRSNVTIENVLFNPPGGDFLNEPANETVSGLLNGQIVVNNAIKNYQANNIRSHVGDRYYVGDSVIDVFYTVDFQYPQKFNYYNTCSMMLSITIAGQKIMITGDASNDAFGKAVKTFGSALKSDIVQAAHHGGTSGVDASAATSMSDGYKLMSPSVVLWPAADEGYESSKKSAFNKVLLSLPTIKRVEVAGDRDFVVILPYNP